MKKITFLLVSLLALFSLVGKADPGDVILIEILQETDPQEIPRSSTPEVVACYLVSSSLLEVQFNVNLGNAVVEVTDQTGISVGADYLSSTPGSLFLPLEIGSGIYSMSIETTSGDRYTGRFIL